MSRKILIYRGLEKEATETFIDAHCKKLPGPPEVVSGNPPSVKGVWQFKPRPMILASLAGSLAKNRKGKPIGTWFQSACLTRILRNGKYRVVLAEYGVRGTEILEACIQTGTPLVVHFHGFDAACTRILVEYGERYRQMFDYCQAIIAVSKSMRERLLENGADPLRTHVIPYGVNTLYFTEGDPGSAGPRFLAVGRFVDKKAPHLTLFAFAKVLEELPNAKLVMVGDGPLLSVCKALVRQLEIDHQVEFLGVQDREFVRRQMRESRVFVQHSVVAGDGDREGTPVAILEASASGLPVVATKHEGICEAVRHGETGLLVNEHDVNGMAAHLLRLAKDQELARTLGATGREHIRKNYSEDSQLEKLVAVLEKARR